MQLLLLGLRLPTVAASSSNLALPPNFNANYTDHATRLRSALLSGYDKAVPPKSQRVETFSAAGTDVYVQMRFFKVMDLSTSTGRMMLKVWLRFRWTDLRLAWDHEQYGGITSVKFHANSFATPEDSEIWLPDITVYNTVSGLMHSFDPAMARASSDGTVYWSRQGSLEVLCRFSGLVSFPFENEDGLNCPIDLGGWIAGAGTQGIYADPNGGCATIERNEEVSTHKSQARALPPTPRPNPRALSLSHKPFHREGRRGGRHP